MPAPACGRVPGAPVLGRDGLLREFRDATDYVSLNRGLRDWRDRRAEQRWRRLFETHAEAGEQVFEVISCTYGSDPQDRRMAALTDAALYLCADPPRADSYVLPWTPGSAMQVRGPGPHMRDSDGHH